MERDQSARDLMIWLRRASWGNVHWTDLALVLLVCAVPILSAYKIWANSAGLLRYMGVVVLIGVAVRGRANEEAQRLFARFRTPVGVLAAVTIVYALSSSLWSPNIAYAFSEALKTLWLVASAVIVGARLAEISNPQLQLWLAIVTAIGLLLLSIEIATQFAVLEQIYGATRHQRVNPNVIALSMLAWPAIGALAAGGKTLAAVALWIFAAALVAAAPSGAAAFGFAVSSIFFALAWISIPLGIWAGTAAAVGGVLLAPFSSMAAGAIMAMLPTRKLVRKLDGAHPLERIDIWSRHSDSIDQAPIFGIGFKGLGPDHPHNAALQIWVEFGLIGMLLAATLIALAGIALLRSPGSRKPFLLASAMSIYANACVSYGMWESQWIGIMLLVAVITISGLPAGHGAVVAAVARNGP